MSKTNQSSKRHAELELEKRLAFKDRIAFVDSLQDMTVSEEELAAIVTIMKSDRYQQIARQVNQMAESLAGLAAKDFNLKSLPTEVLIVLHEGHLALQLGLKNLLPSGRTAGNPRERLGILFALFCHRVADPWPAIQLVIILETFGPWIDPVLSKRLDQHVGALYAATPFIPEEYQEGFLLRLCSLSLNKKAGKDKTESFLLDSTARSAIMRALHGGILEERQQEAFGRVQSAVAAVLGRHILPDPLWGMAKALDGGYDSNPKFVAWQHARDKRDDRGETFQGIDRGGKAGSQYRPMDIDFYRPDDQNAEIADSADGDPLTEDEAKQNNVGDTKPAAWLKQEVPIVDLEVSQPPTPNYLDDVAQEEAESLEAARALALQKVGDLLCAENAEHKIGRRALEGEGLQKLAKKAKASRQTIAKWRENFKEDRAKILKYKYKHLFF